MRSTSTTLTGAKRLPAPTRTARPRALLTLLLLGTAACAGNLAGSLGSGTEGSTPGAGGGVDITDGGTGFVGSSGDVESTTLHRLNSSEYDNSVRDLLGSKLSFSAKFLADETANGFDNNASALSISTSRLHDYELAAEALAAELTADTEGQLATLAPCPSNAQPATCVTSFVTNWGQKAWRRPLTAGEISAIVAIASSTANATYAEQIGQATVALLMSPYFLYRVELGNGRSGSALTAYELASRLSYFLWSSVPDAELTAAAADGSLIKDDVLTAQVRRMRADPKAAAFTDNFTGQWLQLRGTAAYAPDPGTFPDFDEDLRSSALAQTRATFTDLIGGEMAFHELFDGNTTYVNDRLAKFYGMPLPGSTEIVKVAATDRRGILTQAAVLMAVSLPNRTSLVHRGVFLLNSIVCAPPPGAPPNVPSLESSTVQAKTQRQRLEDHAVEPGCAVCHNVIDPYGFVLEAFDAIGAHRDTENGATIDTSATLPNGTKVSNVQDLSAALASDSKSAACMVQQLSTYAVGRTMMRADAAQINAVLAKFQKDGQRVDHLLESIVLSPIFRNRS